MLVIYAMRNRKKRGINLEAKKGEGRQKKRPRRDSNSQSSDSKSDALSIRPRGLSNLERFESSY